MLSLIRRFSHLSACSFPREPLTFHDQGRVQAPDLDWLSHFRYIFSLSFSSHSRLLSLYMWRGWFSPFWWRKKSQRDHHHHNILSCSLTLRSQKCFSLNSFVSFLASPQSRGLALGRTVPTSPRTNPKQVLRTRVRLLCVPSLIFAWYNNQ